MSRCRRMVVGRRIGRERHRQRVRAGVQHRAVGRRIREQSGRGRCRIQLQAGQDRAVGDRIDIRPGERDRSLQYFDRCRRGLRDVVGGVRWRELDVNRVRSSIEQRARRRVVNKSARHVCRRVELCGAEECGIRDGRRRRPRDHGDRLHFQRHRLRRHFIVRRILRRELHGQRVRARRKHGPRTPGRTQRNRRLRRWHSIACCPAAFPRR